MTQKEAELISLGLTVPTLTLSAYVVLLWGPAAIKAALKEHRSATQWFILGVAAGFAGSFGDNLYWAFPWTAEFLELPSKDSLMMRGVYFNIFSRQLAGIFSAYCHIRSYYEYRHRNDSLTLHGLTIVSLSMGVLAVILLLLLESP